MPSSTFHHGGGSAKSSMPLSSPSSLRAAAFVLILLKLRTCTMVRSNTSSYPFANYADGTTDLLGQLTPSYQAQGRSQFKGRTLQCGAHPREPTSNTVFVACSSIKDNRDAVLHRLDLIDGLITACTCMRHHTCRKDRALAHSFGPQRVHALCTGCEGIAASDLLRPLRAVRKSTGVECQSHAALTVASVHPEWPGRTYVCQFPCI